MCNEHLIFQRSWRRNFQCKSNQKCKFYCNKVFFFLFFFFFFFFLWRPSFDWSSNQIYHKNFKSWLRDDFKTISLSSWVWSGVLICCEFWHFSKLWYQNVGMGRDVIREVLFITNNIISKLFETIAINKVNNIDFQFLLHHQIHLQWWWSHHSP